jgi:hypothetical protein
MSEKQAKAASLRPTSPAPTASPTADSNRQ